MKSYVFRSLNIVTLLSHIKSMEPAITRYRNEPIGFFVPWPGDEEDLVRMCQEIAEEWEKIEAIKPKPVESPDDDYDVRVKISPRGDTD